MMVKGEDSRWGLLAVVEELDSSVGVGSSWRVMLKASMRGLMSGEESGVVVVMKSLKIATFKCKCFDVLYKQDDKGDASNRDNGSCLGRNLGGDSDLGRASCCVIGLSLSPIN
ncbi:hypothetical protein V6N13_130132 [Hibiscus sabdariffa]